MRTGLNVCAADCVRAELQRSRQAEIADFRLGYSISQAYIRVAQPLR